jgi:hypothetical protein
MRIVILFIWGDAISSSPNINKINQILKHQVS